MAAAAPVYCTDLIVHPSATSIDETNTTSCSTSSLDSKPQTFRGLSNQGATCYMNSLLQTLYMTAEFRHTLYKWTYNPERDGDEQYCIPLQLQKLFGMLQLSASRAVDTVALTKSFGWEGNERFQQQDVQELCRVLFDALEECFKGHADVENFIDDLYAGELIDYIKCMDVDYQSERKDKFLDYSVAIRPFGAEESMKSIRECIEHYLEPEILDGDNQYFAESVGRKVDAIKGLKFGSLPNVMAVQMKRFVFDFTGESIVQKKINDKVTFPLFLDMNNYVSKGKSKDGEECVDEFDNFLQRRIRELRSGKEQGDSMEKLDDKENLPDLVDCNGTLIPDVETPEEEQITEDSFDHEVDPLKLVEEKGEWVYQLYAVLVHSGAISGGHYYVYIRDTSTNKWWNFNDSSVTEVSEKTVLEAQGGFTTTNAYSSASHSSYGRYTSAYPARQVESCANAYMLMYRKVTPAVMNIDFPGDDLVPDYIRAEVKRITDEAEKKRLENAERLNRITVSVMWRKKKYDIASTKTTLYKDFLQQVWAQLPINEDEEELFQDLNDKTVVPLDRVRLRVFNTYHKVAGLPFSVQESGEKTLDLLKISFNRELFIEVKGQEDEWEYYEVDGVNILMTEFDSVSRSFKDHVVMRMPRRSTLGELRKRVTPSHCDVDNIRLMKLSVWAYTDVKAVEFVNDELTLVPQLQVFEGQKLFWEEKTGPMDESLAVEAFKNNANQICVNLKDDRVKENKLTKVMIDKRWTLTRLRSHVRETLDLDDEFRLCKFSPPQTEINGEVSKSLSSLGFYNGMTIVVKPGPPLLPGHFNVKVFVFKPSYHARVRNLGEELPDFATTSVKVETAEEDAPAPSESPVKDLESGIGIVEEVIEKGEIVAPKNTFGFDKVSFLPTADRFEFLTDLPVHEESQVSDLRELLLERLKAKQIVPDNVTPKQIRICLKNGLTCGDILIDSRTLRQSKVHLFADRALAVQMLDHEEDIEPIETSNALVFVRRWLRSTWELTPPTEILLKGNMPVCDIASALASQYGISTKSMKVLVAHPYTVVNICDLQLQSPSMMCDWIDPTLESKTLSDVKWHLTFGDTIIIQDESESLRALTTDEMKSIGDAKVLQTQYPSDYSQSWWDDDAVPAPAATVSGTVSTVPVGPLPRRVVQTGIVIKTQKDREMEKMKSNSDTALVELSECQIRPEDNDGCDNVSGCNILFGDVD